MSQRTINLSESDAKELARIRDTGSPPYLRERAAAILKIAEGVPAAVVARERLLRHRRPDTVYEWLNRFSEGGIQGLKIHPGRGRKAAFFPSMCRQ